MRTVVCSFLTGIWPLNRSVGDRYAQIVARTVAQRAPDAEFVLFTDRAAIAGVNCRPLPKLAGWFGSLYQFSPDAFPEGTRVLSIDLDTAIIGDLAPLLTADLDTLVGINDRGITGEMPPRLANGVMSWIAGPRYWPIWLNFKPFIGGKPPFKYKLSPKPIATDEAWLALHIGPEWRGWDTAAPGTVVSYKWHILRHELPIGDARVVYFHGRPRPHAVDESWNPLYMPGVPDPAPAKPPPPPPPRPRMSRWRGRLTATRR